MRKTHAIRAENVQKWADRVKPEDLKDAGPEVAHGFLRRLAATLT